MTDITTQRVRAADLEDPELREALLDLWVAVTDAGGSVGFSAPADRAKIEAALTDELEPVVKGRDDLVVMRDGTGTIIGMGMLRNRGNPLFDHWRTVMRLMIHPDRQGRGLGSRLLLALHELARIRHCEHIYLTVRDGENLERFYTKFGYQEVGRHPGAVRMKGGDRDEIVLIARLG